MPSPAPGARRGDRAAAAAARAPPPRHPRRTGRRSHAGRGPVHRRAPGPARRPRACARRRRRAALRDRGLPVVHRLGPRHHDQPGRAGLDHGRHLEAGYILRTFAAHVRDGLIPNMFPEGDRTGLYHTADATLWYFHASTDISRPPRPGHPPSPAAHPRRDDPGPYRGTRFGIGVDPAMASSAGRGGPRSPGGRQGRRLGRDTAARQDGRDQRPLVQRAPACRTMGARGGGQAAASDLAERADRVRPRSTRASGARRPATSTMLSMASTAMTRRAGRTRSSPWRWRTPSSNLLAGSQWSRSSAIGS